MAPQYAKVLLPSHRAPVSSGVTLGSLPFHAVLWGLTRDRRALAPLLPMGITHFAHKAQRLGREHCDYHAFRAPGQRGER